MLCLAWNRFSTELGRTVHPLARSITSRWLNTWSGRQEIFSQPAMANRSAPISINVSNATSQSTNVSSPSTSPSSSSNILKLKDQSKVKLQHGKQKLSKYFSKKVKKIKETTKDIVNKVENELSNAITNENDDEDTVYEIRIGVPGFGKSFYTARGRGFSTSEKLVKTSYVPPADIAACIPSSQEFEATRQYDFRHIDDHVTSMTEVPPEIPPAELALLITKPAKNELEKFRAIFQWIASNISYDTEAFFSRKKSFTKAPDIIRHKRAVCQGYCNLFYELSTSLGLKTAKIGGWASATRFQVNIDESIAHAWNAMNVDNRWYLLDSCWGAGYISGNGNFNRKFEEFYFATQPDQLIYTHFPESPEWQLLPEKPVTKEEWQSFVTIYPNFFQKRLELVSHTKSIIHVAKSLQQEVDLQLTLNAPSNIHMMHSVLVLVSDDHSNNSSGQSEWLKLDDTWSFYQRTDNQRNFLINFPGPGSYSLEIFLKEKLPLQDSINVTVDDSYEISVKYHIEVTGESTKSPTGPFPKTFSRFQKSNHQLLSPTLPWHPGSDPLVVKLTKSTATDMRVLTSWDNKMLKMDLVEDCYQKTIPLHTGSVFVLASYPNSTKGKFLHLLEFVV